MRLFLTLAMLSATTCAVAQEPAYQQPSQPSDLTATNERVEDEKITLLISAEGFSVVLKSTGEFTPVASSSAILVCSEVTASKITPRAAVISCTNCQITLPKGIEAKAAEIVYDSAQKSVTLTGTEQSPVEIAVMVPGGTQARLTAPSLKIDLATLEMSSPPYGSSPAMAPTTAPPQVLR